MKKIFLIIGARPNFMKAFPVYQALKEDFDLTLIHTGQHFDEKMSKVFFEQLKFPKPDIHLTLDKRTKAGDYDDKLYVDNNNLLNNKDSIIEELTTYSGDLGHLGEIRDKLKTEFEKGQPDLVIVFGDVTSTLAAGLAAKMLNIELAHVESGLRSDDIKMPEEVNRILTDHITKYYFITEQSGVDNLSSCGITENVYLVGNTMIDTQKRYLQQALDTKYHEKLGVKSKEYILITLHRPSNVDDMDKLREIFDDFQELSKTEKLVYPIHPRTKNNLEKLGYLEKVQENSNILLEEPLGYLEFTCLMANCKYVVTDSGGLQEETTALDIPCFTLRENTERPCTLIENNGTNQMISKISEIELKECKGSMDSWDGKSSERICNTLKDRMKILRVAVGYAHSGKNVGGVRRYIENIEKLSKHNVTLYPSYENDNLWREKYDMQIRNDYRKNEIIKKKQEIIDNHDVFHSNVDPTWIKLCEEAQRQGKLWIHTYHNIYMAEDEPDGKLLQWQQEINDIQFNIASKADYKLCVGEWLVDECKKRNINSKFIPNFIPIDKLSTIKKNNFKNRHQLKEFILFSGDVSVRKNCVEFVKTAKLLPHYTFVLIGTGLTTEEIIKTHNIELTDNVIAMGPLSHTECLEAMNDCSILVMNSFTEGLPTVLIEAMYYETPCIIPDGPDWSKHLLKDNNLGYKYPIGDINKLAEKITDIMKDYKELPLAKKYVEDIFSSNAVISKLDILYKSKPKSVTSKPVTSKPVTSKQKFMILSDNRSGSTQFVRIISSISSTKYLDEPHKRLQENNFNLWDNFLKRGNYSIDEFYKWCFFEMPNRWNNNKGYDFVKTNSIAFQYDLKKLTEIINFCVENKIIIIILHRNDIFSKSLSSCIAGEITKQTNTNGFGSLNEKLEIKDFEINLKQLEKLYTEYNEFYNNMINYLDKNGIKYHYITYEDIYLADNRINNIITLFKKININYDLNNIKKILSIDYKTYKKYKYVTNWDELNALKEKLESNKLLEEKPQVNKLFKTDMTIEDKTILDEPNSYNIKYFETDLTKIILNKQIHYNYNGIDFMYNNNNNKKLLILFHGAVKLNLKKPVFYGYNIDPNNYDILSFSDPLIKKYENLELSWFLATDSFNTFEFIKDVINNIKLKYTNVLCHGSSGGGFPSLLISSYFKFDCIINNSQIYLSKYFSYSLLKNTVKDLIEIDIEKKILEIGLPNKLYLFQNMNDEEHVNYHYNQFKLFLKSNFDCCNVYFNEFIREDIGRAIPWYPDVEQYEIDRPKTVNWIVDTDEKKYNKYCQLRHDTLSKNHNSPFPEGVSKHQIFSDILNNKEIYLYKEDNFKKNLLISSLDNKFFIEIVEKLKQDFNVKIDMFHENNDDKREELLNWADIVFCEWCEVNALWYSQNKKSHQELFIRLHRYELFTSFFYDINWKNVNNLIFIAPEMKRLANKHLLQKKNLNENNFDWEFYLKNNNDLFEDIDKKNYNKNWAWNHWINYGNKMNWRRPVIKLTDDIDYAVICDEFKDFNGGELIWNYVKSDMFLDLPKLEGSEFNIGIVGILPKIKRPDIALDIIENLIKKDKRYKLFILGKWYNEWGGTLKNNKETEYYKKLEERINSSNLKNHIVFDKFTPEVHKWFQKIGFILSVSDIEGCHQSVAEAMASGTIPLIYGKALKEYKLDEVYPKKYCFYEDTVDKLCDKIYLYSQNKEEKNIISEECKNYSNENFKIDDIYNIINKLINN